MRNRHESSSRERNQSIYPDLRNCEKLWLYVLYEREAYFNGFLLSGTHSYSYDWKGVEYATDCLHAVAAEFEPLLLDLSPFSEFWARFMRSPPESARNDSSSS